MATVLRAAVRETGLSRHHWDHIMGHPETSRKSRHYYTALKLFENHDTMIPRDWLMGRPKTPRKSRHYDTQGFKGRPKTPQKSRHYDTEGFEGRSIMSKGVSR